jgi:hypothetical protein
MVLSGSTDEVRPDDVLFPLSCTLWRTDLYPTHDEYNEQRSGDTVDKLPVARSHDSQISRLDESRAC